MIKNLLKYAEKYVKIYNHNVKIYNHNFTHLLKISINNHTLLYIHINTYNNYYKKYT